MKRLYFFIALALTCHVHAQYTPVEDLTYTINNGEVTITGQYGYYSLTDLNIPPTIEGLPVTRIGDNAFHYGSLRSAILPASVTHIGDGAFANNPGYYNKMESIEMPGVTHIGESAFYGTYLTSVTLPASLISIGNSAFSGCTSLTSFSVASGNPNFASLGGVLFNKAITELLYYPLGNTATTYSVPQGVQLIHDDAFFDCTSITSITLPDSLTSIGDSAFFSCTSLTSFSVASGNPNFASLDGVLFNKAITELLYYPIGNTATTYSVPQGVQLIHDHAFFDCTSITSITLPDSLTSIGTSAFRRCSLLSSVAFADALISIGELAFYDCNSLTSITLPDSLNSIGDSAFTRCTSLTSVTLPDSLTSMDDHAFARCTSLTSVTFLGNAPTRGSYVFLSTPATIYIYEGATGFGNTFGGRPVVVLAAPPLPIDSITVENGNLKVKPTNGTEGITIEQTDDLVDGTWTTITPTIVDGCFQLPASGTAGYYRLSN